MLKSVQNVRIYLSFLSTYSGKCDQPQDFAGSLYRGIVNRLGFRPIMDLRAVSYPESALQEPTKIGDMAFVPIDALLVLHSTNEIERYLGTFLFSHSSLLYRDALEEIAKTGKCSKFYGELAFKDVARLSAYSAVYFETEDLETGKVEVNVLRSLPEEPFVLKYYNNDFCEKEGITIDNFYTPILPKLLYGNTEGFHRAYNKILCKQILSGVNRRKKVYGREMNWIHVPTGKEYSKIRMLLVKNVTDAGYNCTQVEGSHSVNVFSKEEFELPKRRTGSALDKFLADTNPDEQENASGFNILLGTKNVSIGDMLFIGKP